MPVPAVFSVRSVVGTKVSLATVASVAAMLAASGALAVGDGKPSRGGAPMRTAPTQGAPRMAPPSAQPSAPRMDPPAAKPSAPRFEPPTPKQPAPRYEPPAPKQPAPRYEPPAPKQPAPRYEPPAPKQPSRPVTTPRETDDAPIRTPSVKPTPRAPVPPAPESKRPSPPIREAEPPVAKPRDDGRNRPATPPAPTNAKPSDGGRPSTEPSQGKPEVAKPESKPETRRPESSKPAAKPETQRPEAPKPTAKPETKRPEASKPNRGATPTVPPTSSDAKPSAKPRPETTGAKDRTEPKSPERGTADPSKPGLGKKPSSNEASATEPTTTASLPSATSAGKKPERFVDDEVFGVPVKGDGATRGSDARGPRADGAAGVGVGDVIANGNDIDQTVVINNNTYNTYVENIYDANGWDPYGHGSSAGPCHTWERYDCNDGISIAIGFGGGFSFGFFYGSSCAPLCTSWSNPWWCGYATSWNCGPSWYGCRPWYSWCHRPWWRDWDSCVYWTSSWSTPCPRPWWTPCYSYTPVVYTPYAYTQVVYQPVVVQAPPPLPAPATLWGYLADGYDDDAAEGFAVLAVADPNEGVWFAAQGLALAFRGDEARGADLLRDAFLADPSAMTRIDRSPRLATRIEALERVLSPFANGSPASVDALLVIAACQAARGDLAQAYFTATTAQAEGDRSAGTASFVAWLNGELRRKI